MKLIRGSLYLDKLIESIGTPDIKAITGVRRSGKSKPLEAFKDHLLETVADANAIHFLGDVPSALSCSASLWLRPLFR